MSLLEAVGMSYRHYRSHQEQYPGTILSGDEGHQYHYDYGILRAPWRHLILSMIDKLESDNAMTYRHMVQLDWRAQSRVTIVPDSLLFLL